MLKRVLVLVVLIIAVCGIAASAEVVSGVCGAIPSTWNAKWSLDTETGAFTISGKGNTRSDWNYSSVPWNNYRAYIKSVEITASPVYPFTLSSAARSSRA